MIESHGSERSIHRSFAFAGLKDLHKHCTMPAAGCQDQQFEQAGLTFLHQQFAKSIARFPASGDRAAIPQRTSPVVANRRLVVKWFPCRKSSNKLHARPANCTQGQQIFVLSGVAAVAVWKPLANRNLLAASRVAEQPRGLRLAVVSVAQQTAAGQHTGKLPSTLASTFGEAASGRSSSLQIAVAKIAASTDRGAELPLTPKFSRTSEKTGHNSGGRGSRRAAAF